MDINLLPWREEIVEYNKKVFMRLILGALILSGIFLVFIYYLFFSRVSYEVSYTDALEKAKLNLVGNVAAYFSYQKVQKEVNARYIMLQKLQSSRFETIALLNGLARVTPLGIYMKKLVRRGDRLELTGVATSNLLIAQMMQSIEGSKHLKVISLQKVEKTESQHSTVTEFDLQLALTTPASLSEETAKQVNKLQMQNSDAVIQQDKTEQNKKNDDAAKK